MGERSKYFCGFSQGSPNPVSRHHHPDIPRQGHGEPVDDGLNDGGGSEAVGHARGVGAQHAAPGAARDKQALLIDPALGDHRIHDAHEIFVVRPRVGFIDFLREGLAIAVEPRGFAQTVT